MVAAGRVARVRGPSRAGQHGGGPRSASRRAAGGGHPAAGLLAGWVGAAVAAPWPMPVAAVTAAAMARHREPGTRPGVVCAAIGLGCIVGTFIEPVTRRPRSWSVATRLAIGINLAASAALVGAGAWHA